MLSDTSIYERLSKCLQAHYRKMQPWRELRIKLLSDYQGTLYPDEVRHELDDDERLKEILPLTWQACEAMVMALAANTPRALVTTHNPTSDAFAAKMQRAINRYAERTALDETLQEIVRDSYFGLGIGKACMSDSIMVGFEQELRIDPGSPFLQRICVDNLVLDTNANKFSQMSFCSDRYSVSYEQFMEDERFKDFRDEHDDIKPTTSHRASDNWSDRDRGTQVDELEDTLWLCDSWIASRGIIATHIVREDFALVYLDPVNEQEWVGSRSGCYEFLNLGQVPDRLWPASPGQHAKLLNELANTLYRKLEDQARRQKTVTVGSAMSDGEDTAKLRDLRDGEHAELQAPDQVKQYRFDGPDQNLFGFALNAQHQYSKAAGNLDYKTGTGATTDTVGQETMVGTNVNRMEGYLSQRLLKFTRCSMTQVARLLFEDKFTEIQGQLVLPNTKAKISVDDTWRGALNEGERQGRFEDYELQIDPQSMPYRSAAERAQKLRAELAAMMPILPMLQQMGIHVDLQSYFKTLSELENMPEYLDLFQFDKKPVIPEGGSTQPSGHQAKSEYVHRGAGPTAPNPDQVAMSMMSSASQAGQN